MIAEKSALFSSQKAVLRILLLYPLNNWSVLYCAFKFIPPLINAFLKSGISKEFTEPSLCISAAVICCCVIGSTPSRYFSSVLISLEVTSPSESISPFILTVSNAEILVGTKAFGERISDSDNAQASIFLCFIFSSL